MGKKEKKEKIYADGRAYADGRPRRSAKPE